MTFAPYTAVRGCGKDGPGAANMLYWLDRESPWRERSALARHSMAVHR